MKLIASIIHQNQIHLSQTFSLERSPWTPVSILVHGIFERWKENSFYILRNKINVNYHPTELCYGMAKVAAKGLRLDTGNELDSVKLKEFPSYVYSLEEFPISDGFDQRQAAMVDALSVPGLPTNHSDWMECAENLVRKSLQKTEFLYERHRPIAALLVSSRGQLLDYAINTNRINKVQHAEWNLLSSFWSKTKSPLPPGSSIYTTRKCCKMCAGLIWHCSENPYSMKVYYREFDAGSSARNTVLNRGSPEQKRILSPPFFMDFEKQI